MKRAQFQKQAKEDELQKKKEKEKEKERGQERERETEKMKRSCSLSSKSKKGAESKRAEPASGGTAEKKVAKLKLAASASVSGSSRASTSKGPGPGMAETKWKSSQDMMEYLTALHSDLYSSPKARELKERIQVLYRGFHAREKIRKTSYLQNRELVKNQPGYSRKKRKLHEQWLVEDQSHLSTMDNFTQEAGDEDAYDTEADDELDRLEQSLCREKASQGRWRKEHQQATEAREQ